MQALGTHCAGPTRTDPSTGFPARAFLIHTPENLLKGFGHDEPAGEGELLVRSRWGATSVGAELALFRGEMRTTEPLYPRMSGYENLAEVEEVGRGVARGRVGREVVAWFGHRSRALVRRDRVIPVPAGLRDRPASLLAVEASAHRRALPRAFGANRTHASLDRLPRHAATLAFDCSGSASDFGRPATRPALPAP